jgi:hypothetical protein
VILVCDAGGGTTVRKYSQSLKILLMSDKDVNIMKIRSNVGEALRVEQLIEVEGMNSS